MALTDVNDPQRKKEDGSIGLTSTNKYARRVYVFNLGGFVIDGVQYPPVSREGSVTSVASSTLTDIINYTVPVGEKLFLYKIEVSGCNVAKFQIDIEGSIKGVRRTYWGNFNADFEFNRLELNSGETIKVQVIHERPNTGDFEATIIGNQGPF